MAWDITIPLDTVAANTLHTVIQTAKKDIREMLWAWNGTFAEHSFYGSSSITQRHIPSIVGWCAVWDSYGDLLAFTAKPQGSIHYVTSADIDHIGVYVVDANNQVQKATILDHTLLDGTYATTTDVHNDHTQYYCIKSADAMAGTMYLYGTSSLVFSGDSSGLSGDAIGSGHVTASWGDAHTSDGGLIARHFVAGFKAPDISTTEDGMLYSIQLGAFYKISPRTKIGYGPPFMMFWPSVYSVNIGAAPSYRLFTKAQLEQFNGPTGYDGDMVVCMLNLFSVGRWLLPY